MKIISMVNQKGGVGKTTSAVNLATAMAAVGKKCLLVDLDSQGNASTGFGIEVENRNPSSYEVLLDGVSIDDAIKETAVPGMYVVPATIDLSACDLQLANKIGREFLLKKAFENMQAKFDYVFIDCPPSLGLLTVNAMTASNYIFIPLQCEFYSLEGLSYLLNTLELVKGNLNPTLEVGGVLLTMYDRRNRVTAEVEGEVRKYFGDKVFKTYIPRNVKLSEAPSHGVPGILYDHRSSGAKAYMVLAREVYKRFG